MLLVPLGLQPNEDWSVTGGRALMEFELYHRPSSSLKLSMLCQILDFPLATLSEAEHGFKQSAKEVLVEGDCMFSSKKTSDEPQRANIWPCDKKRHGFKRRADLCSLSIRPYPSIHSSILPSIPPPAPPCRLLTGKRPRH